jgi:hypothetical protein
MAKVKVLVLGNDPQINSIEFDKLHPQIITLGVNRIWLKYIPNYFFFNDIDIIRELSRRPEDTAKLIQKSTIFSSDWLTRDGKFKDIIPSWVKIYHRPSIHQLPDSITTGLQLFSKHYIPSSECTFYIAGVSLMWQEPSHFWKDFDYTAENKMDAEWYTPRFTAMLDNFKKLKRLNYDIVSVNPKSALNKYFRYENIGNLYKKSL